MLYKDSCRRRLIRRSGNADSVSQCWISKRKWCLNAMLLSIYLFSSQAKTLKQIVWLKICEEYFLEKLHLVKL